MFNVETFWVLEKIGVKFLKTMIFYVIGIIYSQFIYIQYIYIYYYIFHKKLWRRRVVDFFVVYFFVCGFGHWSRSQKNYDVKGMNLILGFMGFLPEILVTLVGQLLV